MSLRLILGEEWWERGGDIHQLYKALPSWRNPFAKSILTLRQQEQWTPGEEKIKMKSGCRKWKDLNHKFQPANYLDCQEILSYGKRNSDFMQLNTVAKAHFGIPGQQPGEAFKVCLGPFPRVSFAVVLFSSCSLNGRFSKTAHSDRLVSVTPFPSYLPQPTRAINPDHCAGD